MTKNNQNQEDIEDELDAQDLDENDEGEGGEGDDDADDQGDDGEGGEGADEARLRELGWVPKEEFKGKPEKWMDAQTFQQKRGDELSQLRRELRDNNRELREAQKTIKDLAEFNRTREERAYNRALENLKKEKRQAVRDGDEDRYNEIEAQERDLQKEAPPAKKQQPDGDEPPEEAKEWVKDNPWFLKDPDLNAAAQAYHVTLNKQNPNLPLADNLKKTAEHIKRMFPEKFKSDPPKRRSADLEGNRLNAVRTGGSGKKKTVADLPADAVEVGKRFVKQGIFKSLDEYAKDYFDQE